MWKFNDLPTAGRFEIEMRVKENANETHPHYLKFFEPVCRQVSELLNHPVNLRICFQSGFQLHSGLIFL